VRLELYLIIHVRFYDGNGVIEAVRTERALNEVLLLLYELISMKMKTLTLTIESKPGFN